MTAQNRWLDRRGFLRDTALIGAAAVAVHNSGCDEVKKSPDMMPTITLGKVEVSRLILGSNPFFGFAHGNPQASAGEMRKWYTDERVIAVMDEAAERGISAVWTPSYDRWIRLWNAYRKKGGKLKTWIGQPDKFDRMEEHITACATNGSKVICIQGACVDRAFRDKKHDLVRRWLDLIHSFHLPAGIATHRPTTHLIAEQKKLPTDFYHQCIYQPDNYSPKCREQALATIRELTKPVIAYKVLAAGRVDPKKAFAHLLKQLKPKDGLCVGMLPNKNPDQVAENASLIARLSRIA